MEKEIAIEILKDIRKSLYTDNWKEKRIRDNKDISKKFRTIYKFESTEIN